MAETIASEKALGIIAKIKAKQWKAMGETVTQMREFTESGGVKTFLENLKETWSLQVQNALSPLTNEVSELVAEALKPIMPMITTMLNDATISVEGAVKAWKGLLTGQWDDFFSWMTKHATDDMKKLKNQINQWWYDLNKDFESWLEEAAKAWTQWGKDVGTAWSNFWRSMGWK